MIKILVTGAGGGVGQGIIKSLRLITDLDIKIISADMSAKATGLYAGDVAYLVAACTADNYLDSLGKIFTTEKVDFYFPGTDVELIFCAKNKDMIFERYGVRTVVSPLSAIAIADDKYETFKFLKKNGFSCPETRWASEIDLTQIKYPVIIKPAIGCRSIGVYLVKNEQDLKSRMPDPKGIVVQEFIGNEDSEYTCTVVKCEKNISTVVILKRELRSGDTFRAEPVESQVISDYVTQIALKLNIEGSCNFQLRLDRDGIPKIFEINCRFSGTTPFCAQLGFNPVEYYLKHSLGIEYEGRVNFNSIVLRYWSEIVVSKSQIENLNTEGHSEPKIIGQSSLF